MESKTDLRTRFKTARKQLDILKISRNIEENIRALDFYQKSKSVMLFYPTEYEINLLGLLNDKNKNFYFPKVKKTPWKNLYFPLLLSLKRQHLTQTT